MLKVIVTLYTPYLKIMNLQLISWFLLYFKNPIPYNINFSNPLIKWLDDFLNN